MTTPRRSAKPPKQSSAKQSAAVDKETQARFGELLQRAHAGDLQWLDKAVRAAGYGDPPGDQIVVTSRQVEQGLELSRRQVQQYVTDGMPRTTKAYGNRAATFEVWACWRWMREWWKRLAAGGLPEQEAADYERQKKRAELMKVQAEGEIKRREAALKAGALVDRAKVEADVNMLLRTLQSRMEALPAELASDVVGQKSLDVAAETARERIQDAWNSAIEELRRMLPEKQPELPPFGPQEEKESL